MAETTQEYRQRMLDNLEGKDPIQLQMAALKKLDRLLARIAKATSAKLRRRPAPGKWSIAEIAAHLADTELVVGWRIRQILGAPGTQIQAFDQDAWASAMNCAKRDVRKSLASYRALRELNLALLKSLTPAQKKLSGIHSERGEESVFMNASMLAGHDINHFQQIERTLAS